jgi:hypothetical protein
MWLKTVDGPAAWERFNQGSAEQTLCFGTVTSNIDRSVIIPTKTDLQISKSYSQSSDISYITNKWMASSDITTLRQSRPNPDCFLEYSFFSFWRVFIELKRTRCKTHREDCVTTTRRGFATPYDSAFSLPPFSLDSSFCARSRTHVISFRTSKCRMIDSWPNSSG